MRNLTFYAVVLMSLVFSLPAYSSNKEREELLPIATSEELVEASPEMVAVVQAILSFQGMKEVAKFSREVDTIENVRVTKDLNRIVILGTFTGGGDIMRGIGGLVIDRTFVSQVGHEGTKVPVYKTKALFPMKKN